MADDQENPPAPDETPAGAKARNETSSPDAGRPEARQGVAGWYALIGIGFEFLAAICLMGAIGFYLDRRLGTSPWLLIVGGAVGFAAGLTLVIRAGLGAFKD